MKHTPGPWYKASSGPSQGLVISETTGATVAVTYDKRDTDLVAAAPELLSLCREALHYMETPGDFSDKDVFALMRTLDVYGYPPSDEDKASHFITNITIKTKYDPSNCNIEDLVQVRGTQIVIKEIKQEDEE